MSYRSANKEFGESPFLGVVLGAVAGAAFYLLLQSYLLGGYYFNVQETTLFGICPGAFGGVLMSRRGSLVEETIGGIAAVILMQVICMLVW